MIESILKNLIDSIKGAHAAIFLDGDGESIVQAGETIMDMKLLGAWKEIHLDHIREITERLGLGGVSAVLFSQEEGNVLIIPVMAEYSLLLFMSSYSDIQDAMKKLKDAVEAIRKDIE